METHKRKFANLADSTESVTVLPIDRRKLANHYHVLTGLPGYMPANNYPCETLKEAGDVALYEANQFREAGYHRDFGKDA